MGVVFENVNGRTGRPSPLSQMADAEASQLSQLDALKTLVDGLFAQRVDEKVADIAASFARMIARGRLASTAIRDMAADALRELDGLRVELADALEANVAAGEPPHPAGHEFGPDRLLGVPAAVPRIPDDHFARRVLRENLPGFVSEGDESGRAASVALACEETLALEEAQARQAAATAKLRSIAVVADKIRNAGEAPPLDLSDAATVRRILGDPTQSVSIGPAPPSSDGAPVGKGKPAAKRKRGRK